MSAQRVVVSNAWVVVELAEPACAGVFWYMTRIGGAHWGGVLVAAEQQDTIVLDLTPPWTGDPTDLHLGRFAWSWANTVTK
jgi:hypothetical protein